MTITSVLLVGTHMEALKQQLSAHNYAVFQVETIAQIATVETPCPLAIITQQIFQDADAGVFEQLHFLNTNATTIVYLQNPQTLDNHKKEQVLNGTLHHIFEQDVASGLVCGTIDKIYLHEQLDTNVRAFQQSSQDKHSLEKELTIRDYVLKRERELCESIVSSITDGLVVLDATGMIVLMNAPAIRLLEVPDTCVIGQSFRTVFSEKLQLVIQTMQEEFSRAIEKPRGFKFKQGKVFLHMTGYAMQSENAGATGILLFVDDITEQENTAAHLYRAEKLATIGTMLLGVAHELRNPLSIISARSQLATAKKEWDRPWAIKAFESIEAQVERCASIVNNLLDFTRHTAAASGYYKLGDLFDEALSYANYQNSFDSIVIKKMYKNDIVVFGDRSRYVQVLLNIIVNAADAINESGTLTLRAKAIVSGSVQIEINDSGPGITPENISRIFDPFFTTKEPGKGTGLGLAIACKIMQESGGDLWVTSQPGDTTFFIQMPTGKEGVHA